MAVVIAVMVVEVLSLADVVGVVVGWFVTLPMLKHEAKIGQCVWRV